MKKQNTSAVVDTQSDLQHISDFSGKQLYVGIDVHKENWQVAVYYQGLVLSNSNMEGTSQRVIQYLRKQYGNASFKCVYECGAWGFNLCRDLWAAGMDCIVVNPADILTSNKDSLSKTDQVDARKLAMHHSAGLLLGVDVPSEKLQKQRSLIRFRKKLWQDLVRCKNRLKSELCFQGIIIPERFDTPHWSSNFMAWITQQAHKDECLKDTLLLMLEEVKNLRDIMLKTEKKLREMMQSEDFSKQSGLLRSIPGVGPLTAMLFLLELGDIRRFKSFDHLNRFVGFCPDSHSSAGKDKQTGLTQRGHCQLRSAIIEASWQLIRRDAAMLEDYKKLQQRMKGQQAIIRIARRLLRRMRAVLLSGKVYMKGVKGAVTAKQIAAPDLQTPKPKGRPRKVKVLATAGLRSAD